MVHLTYISTALLVHSESRFLYTMRLTVHSRTLKRTRFLETLRYDATTTAVLSSVTHTSVIFPLCLTQARSPF